MMMMLCPRADQEAKRSKKKIESELLAWDSPRFRKIQ